MVAYADEDQSLKQLAVAVRDKNCSRSFDSLFTRFRPVAVSLIRNFNVRHADPDDLLQEIAFRLVRAIRTYELREHKFVSFAAAVARHTLKDAYDKAKRNPLRWVSLDGVDVQLADLGSPFWDAVIAEEVERQKEKQARHLFHSALESWWQQKSRFLDGLSRRRKREATKLASPRMKTVRKKSGKANPYKGRPVLRLGTGEVYQDAETAAKAVGPGYGKGHVIRAIRYKTFFNESRWEWQATG